MSNDNKCEFCENIFKNSYNLKYHLLNNKSCLKKKRTFYRYKIYL